MKTEHQFAEVLKKMMETMPLEEISVTALSKKCNVSRKTFYYHFRDVYDLLTLVFLDEKITTDNSFIKSNKDLIETIFAYYSKNEKFIDATLDSAGKDLFNEFVFNFCYQTILMNFLSEDEAINYSGHNPMSDEPEKFAIFNKAVYMLAKSKQ